MPVNIAGLNPAKVLQALINAPVAAHEANWPLLTDEQAAALVAPSHHVTMPYYCGYIVRLHIAGPALFGRGYDAIFSALRCADVVERLRQGENFSPGYNPPHPRICALAKPFVPASWGHLQPPAVAVPPAPRLPPPAPAALMNTQCTLPPHQELEASLNCLFGANWYRAALVPTLLKKANTTLRADLFVSFYYLSLSTSSDGLEDNPLVQLLLDPWRSPLLEVLLPDVTTASLVRLLMDLSISRP